MEFQEGSLVLPKYRYLGCIIIHDHEETKGHVFWQKSQTLLITSSFSTPCKGSPCVLSPIGLSLTPEPSSTQHPLSPTSSPFLFACSALSL